MDKSARLKEQNLKHILQTITGRSIKHIRDFELWLYLNSHEGGKLIRALWKYKLPAIKSVSINWIGIADQKVVNLFLLNSIPDQLEELYFNCKGFRMLAGDQYFSAIMSVVPKVTNKLVIKNTILQSAEIKQIHSVGYMWNLIEIEEPNIQKTQSNIVGFVDRWRKEDAYRVRNRLETPAYLPTPSWPDPIEKRVVESILKSNTETANEEAKTEVSRESVS